MGAKIIAFSGGLDSTKIFLDLVDEMLEKDKNEREDIILASFINSGLSKEKIKRETNCREKIISKIKSAYPDLNIYKFEVGYIYNTDEIYNRNKGIYGLIQPVLWITNIIPYLENGCEFLIGYLKDDSASLVLKDIDDAFYSLVKISNIEAKISFPLVQYYTKKDIIEWYIKNGLEEYLDICTFCESDKELDFCGKCVPCKTFKSALVSLILENIHTGNHTYNKCMKLLEEKYNVTFMLKKKMR